MYEVFDIIYPEEGRITQEGWKPIKVSSLGTGRNQDRLFQRQLKPVAAQKKKIRRENFPGR